MTDDLRNKIELFFKNPRDFNGDAGAYSTLYLLRRDVDLCFGFDPNTGAKVDYSTLFPGAMAVLAGIDLVAKFIWGDKIGKVSERFIDYVRRYIDIEYHDELYQLRNALLHSFGLYSEGKWKFYRFRLVRNGGRIVTQLSENLYQIDIDVLRIGFEESIKSYYQDLQASDDLQSKFADMFPKYGSISIG